MLLKRGNFQNNYLLMKKLLSIIVLGLLLSGNAYAEIYELKDCRYINSKSKSEYPGTIKITINTDSKKIDWRSSDESSLVDYTYGDVQSGFVYVQKPYASDDKHSYADWIVDVKNATLRVKVYGTTIFNKTPKYNAYPGQFHDLDCDKNNPISNNTQAVNIEFTIKDKKEQCTAIGFEPATEKFADCVLRLVELDVKTQQTNQIALAQGQGNQQIADQLKKQRSDQSSQYFLDLGQKLLNPQSTVSAPSTSTCTISGGVYKNISCW